MGEEAASFAPASLLEELNSHHVAYVLIGGVAARAYGATLRTGDLDICPPARSLLAEASKCDFVISTQVLQEFYVTVTRKLTRPVPESIAADAVDHLVGFPTVVVDVPYCAAPSPRAEATNFPCGTP